MSTLHINDALLEACRTIQVLSEIRVTDHFLVAYLTKWGPLAYHVATTYIVSLFFSTILTLVAEFVLQNGSDRFIVNVNGIISWVAVKLLSNNLTFITTSTTCICVTPIVLFYTDFSFGVIEITCVYQRNDFVFLGYWLSAWVCFVYMYVLQHTKQVLHICDQFS